MANVSSSNGIEKYPKLRFPEFSDGYYESTLGEIFEYERPDNYIVISEKYSDAYPIPVLTANQAFVLGYTSETSGIYDKGPVILFDDFTCDMKYADFPFKVKSSAMKLLTSKKEIPIFYAYNLLQHINYKPEGHARHWISIMQPLKVLLPCYAEQERIGEFLSLVCKKIEKHQLLIDALKKYKRGLLQAVFSREVQFENSSGWERRLFSELASLSKGKYSPKQNEVLPCIELEHLEQQTGQIIGCTNSNEQNSVKSVFHKGDVLFGKLRPYLRKFALPEYNGVCSSEIWVFHPKPDIDSTFLFYLIQSESFIAAANISSGTKMPRAEWSKVSNETFFVPGLSEQKRIANLFTTIDKRIVNASASVNKLQCLKQGLLQHLFI